MTNAEKYLGHNSLTAAYKGEFFDDFYMDFFDTKIGKVLRFDNKEVVFLVFRKGSGVSIHVLKKSGGEVTREYWVEKWFSSEDQAIDYYEKHKEENH
jgi:hypothetical protein